MLCINIYEVKFRFKIIQRYIQSTSVFELLILNWKRGTKIIQSTSRIDNCHTCIVHHKVICLKYRSKFSTGYFFLDSPHQRNRIFLPATTSSLLLGVIAKRTREKRFTVSSNPVSHSIVCSNLSSVEHTHTHTRVHTHRPTNTGG